MEGGILCVTEKTEREIGRERRKKRETRLKREREENI